MAPVPVPWGTLKSSVMRSTGDAQAPIQPVTAQPMVQPLPLQPSTPTERFKIPGTGSFGYVTRPSSAGAGTGGRHKNPAAALPPTARKTPTLSAAGSVLDTPLLATPSPSMDFTHLTGPALALVAAVASQNVAATEVALGKDGAWSTNAQDLAQSMVASNSNTASRTILNMLSDASAQQAGAPRPNKRAH